MNFKFHKKVLDNGMTVIFEKRNLPVVSVAFAVRNGGINEASDEKGISHFIEHMIYKGTPLRNSKQISQEIEKNGGDFNGFTTEDTTAFFCKMPSEHLNIALEVLGDMMKNPVFDNNECDKERKVIFEELKMRKDTPKVYVYDKIQSLLYDEPMGIDLIGTYETMNSISREKLIQRFKEVYTPENMILCVVGDANFEEIVDFAEKNFTKSGSKVQTFPIKKINSEKIEKRKHIDQANLIFAYHIPLLNDKKSYAAFLLNSLLAGGMSSRLFTEIREKRNLAYSVRGDSMMGSKFAFNSIYVGTTKDNLEKVRELILEEFQKVSSELDEKELEENKNHIIGNYLISMEDSQEQMTNLLSWEINGDANDFYKFKENIENVTLEDVKELAKIKKYSFFALIPEE